MPLEHRFADCLFHLAGVVLIGYFALANHVLLAQIPNSYIITTVAGLGGPGFGGDGTAALYAALSGATGVTVDTMGEIFIADSGNYRVRKINPQGIITTVAGNGTKGFRGDGGPATLAELGGLSGLAVDGSGNVFIADTANVRIRMVTPQGTISTVAGGGSTYGDNQPATAAVLIYPTGIAVDSLGDLFIADQLDARVRKVTPGGEITTVAGGGGSFADGVPATSVSLGEPDAVAVDNLGNLFIADNLTAVIYKVNNQGLISIFAGGGAGFGDGGPATLAELSGPQGVAADPFGDIFIADEWNYRVRKVTPQGLIFTVAGTGVPDLEIGDGGPATLASQMPTSLAIDSFGNLYTTGNYRSAIREIIPAPSSLAGCIYSLDQSYQSLTSAAESGSVGVLTTGTNCSWLAISYADWVTATPMGLQSGLGLVSYTVSENLYPSTRSGIIWIAGQSMTINQAAFVCSWNVTPSTILVPASGLVGASASVTTNSPYCPWNVAANLPWILLGSDNPGEGSETVSFTVGINAGGRRTGTMTVAGQTITIAQAAASCTLTGDSSPSIADVQLIMNEALGNIAATDDLGGSGSVTVADVQIVIGDLLAGACSG